MQALYRGWVDEALAVAGLDGSQYTVTAHYPPSGSRATCVAVAFDHEGDLLAFVAGLGAVAERTGGFNAIDVARDARHGLDEDGEKTLLYFPGWSLSDR